MSRVKLEDVPVTDETDFGRNEDATHPVLTSKESQVTVLSPAWSPTKAQSHSMGIDGDVESGIVSHSLGAPAPAERQQSLRGNVTLTWQKLKVDLTVSQGCVSRLRGEPAPENKPILKEGTRTYIIFVK